MLLAARSILLEKSDWAKPEKRTDEKTDVIITTKIISIITGNRILLFSLNFTSGIE